MVVQGSRRFVTDSKQAQVEVGAAGGAAQHAPPPHQVPRRRALAQLLRHPARRHRGAGTVSDC